MPSFYTILTDVGQAKLANAIALGQTIEITDLAVGDGNGALPTPETSRTALVNEVRRAPINLSEVDGQNPNWVVVEQVLPPDVGGWTIREIGVFDIDGDLIGYGNYPETYKPVLAEGSSRTQTIRFVMEVSNTEAVTLKVDPSVVLATRGYSDSTVNSHNEKTGGVHGIPEGQTALHSGQKASTSEAKQGTPGKFPDAAGVREAFGQFGLGGGSLRSGDINEVVASGFYYSTGNPDGESNRPADADENGFLYVARHGSNGSYACQIFIPYDQNRMFFRRLNGVNGWQPWVEVAHTGNMPAVKATNGYEQLPNGMIRQWGEVTVNTNTQSVIFPIAFPNECVSFQPTHVSELTNRYVISQATGKSQNDGQLALYSAEPGAAPIGNNISLTVGWSAIGY